MFNKKNYLVTIFAFLALIIFGNAFAKSSPKHIIIAPNCLLTNISYTTLTTTKDFSLIEVNKTGLAKLIAAKSKHNKLCGGFINVTESWLSSQKNKTLSFANEFLASYTRPISTVSNEVVYQIQYQPQVKQLLIQLIPENMWNNLSTFSDFSNRHANSRAGVQAATWLKTQVEAMLKQNNRKDAKVFTVGTGEDYKQPSVILRIGDSNTPGIVIGAHMDTLYAYFSNRPGADDDGSGSVTVLELARVLLSSELRFKKTIYLIWYAAEEEGLIGSQHVVAKFKKQNIAIENVLQFDMTGYAHQNDPSLWLMEDYTNKELTHYLATLVDTYVKVPVKFSTCGYACSDHATWTLSNIKAAFPFEADFGKDNPYIHTSQDIMSVLSLEHMTNYLKLAAAFAVELAEPIS